MAKKVIWTDIHKKGNTITPTYYFDFDLLNRLGFPDNELLSFIEEMKIFAEKEMKERSDAAGESKSPYKLFLQKYFKKIV